MRYPLNPNKQSRASRSFVSRSSPLYSPSVHASFLFPSPFSSPLFSSLSFSVLLLFLLSLPFAAAIQVSPAAKTITLGVDALSYELRILNDQDAPLAITLSSSCLDDALISVEGTSFTLPPRTEKRALIILSSDEEKLLPGRNPCPVIIRALPAEGGQFGGAVSLGHNLFLIRPYDGSYLEGFLSATHDGFVLSATLGLVNRGLRGTEAEASLVVIEEHLPLSGTLPLGRVALPGLGEGKLVWNGALPLPNGEYALRAELIYDGVAVGVEAPLVVGSPRVDLVLTLPDPSPDVILAYQADLLLDWNGERSVALRSRLLDGEAVLAESIGSTFTVSPRSTATMRGFLELPPLPAGEYLLEVFAEAENGMVIGEAVSSFVVGRVVTAEEPAEVLNRWPLILVVLLVALGLLAWRLRPWRG